MSAEPDADRRHALDVALLALALQQSTAEKIRRLQARAFDLQRDIREYFAVVVPDFRRDIEEYFLRSFVLNTTLPENGIPVWNHTAAPQAAEQFADAFGDVVTAVEDDLEDDLGDQLADTYDEAYWLGLWQLGLSDEDLADVEGPPDHDAIKDLLIAAGVAGLGYGARLQQWGEVYTDKFAHWVRASSTGGFTLKDTLQGVDAITNGWQQRVEALAGDEIHRAFSIGTSAAWGSVPHAVKAEVWITREDPRVCPLCVSRHMTITPLQPITDSHPSCRCVKAPILVHETTGAPIDYVAFLQRIGKR